MRFQSFAPEIRHTILDLVYENIRAQRPTAQERIRAGHERPKDILYFPASVCREWMDFAQKRNFRQLILSNSCLYEFERIFEDEGKRRLVEHVWLHVELHPYGCVPSSCGNHESPEFGTRNSEVFADAITKLFRILSTWERVGDQRKGITLELSAYSSSDSEHCLQDHCFDAVSYSERDFPVDGCPPGPLDPQRRFLTRKSTDGLDDEAHFWLDGRWAPPDHVNLADVLARAMGAPLRLPADRELALPRVGVVTRFLTGRQFYRAIHLDFQAEIISSLPNLEDFNFEFWYRLAFLNLLDDLLRLSALFERPFQIPQTLKAMTLYEAENVSFTGLFKWPRPCHASGSRLFNGARLALQSQNLEHLSSLYRHMRAPPASISGGDGNIVVPDPWENLETLALTSRVFHPRNPASNAEDILYTAGGAALRMPKLKIMEIWNARDDGWWCSWGMGLEEDGRVKKIWEKVALKHGRRGGLLFDPYRDIVNLSRISVGSVLAGG
ncbi:hypothetical protein B0T22DRAFT_475057 [Podospora appendiculata]|uniref:DUF6546 domain-containing protein n=1 Tax=Podospora appendiculata TaxID=314037 RepID=A0AAE0XEU4_9PEZI|nr:hypothetical protein B0T22DRAFT_475057 [Podospora appendiculata]